MQLEDALRDFRLAEGGTPASDRAVSAITGFQAINSHGDILNLVGQGWVPPIGSSRRILELVEKAKKDIGLGLAPS